MRILFDLVVFVFVFVVVVVLAASTALGGIGPFELLLIAVIDLRRRPEQLLAVRVRPTRARGSWTEADVSLV